MFAYSVTEITTELFVKVGKLEECWYVHTTLKPGKYAQAELHNSKPAPGSLWDYTCFDKTLTH